DGTVKWIEEESSLDMVNLALDTLREGGQSLIFLNTRKSAEAAARNIGERFEGLLPEEERKVLDGLADAVLNASPEPTRQCRKLAEAVSRGVAFHHAGVLSSQRRLIEDAFRKNVLKCLAATTTLAMGLNLPSRRVVIRDWMRYESRFGMQPVPAIEIKQMGGRAGRPRFDPYGESVLVARDRADEKFLFDNYIKGGLENIASQMGNENTLRSHVLASVAGLFTRTENELNDFLGGTFFAFQKGAGSLHSLVEAILAFLAEEAMVERRHGLLKATRFGRRVSELYLDPMSGVILRDALRTEKGKGTFALLHMIARAPDMMTLSLRKKDRDEMIDTYYSREKELLIPDEENFPDDDLLGQLKTARALEEWISETPEDKLVARFGIGPGDLRSLIDLADWLLYSASEISRLFQPSARKPLDELRFRVQYGVREELLDLVSLRGIGRVRARNLFQAGIFGRKEIRRATVDELSRIPTLGAAVAGDIKKQVEEKSSASHR
ncbi:MAG TPA: helicase-related protein, partial [Thermodesulfobacteriota bacterium]|nr:helicase-related protein [Thermodesulfobacteriota bacterium]